MYLFQINNKLLSTNLGKPSEKAATVLTLAALVELLTGLIS